MNKPLLDSNEMAKRFTYHAPKPGQPEKYQALRAAARHFAEAVNELCPSCRETASAITHIEEAAFWANAAIARRETEP